MCVQERLEGGRDGAQGRAGSERLDLIAERMIEKFIRKGGAGNWVRLCFEFWGVEFGPVYWYLTLRGVFFGFGTIKAPLLPNLTTPLSRVHTKSKIFTFPFHPIKSSAIPRKETYPLSTNLVEQECSWQHIENVL